MKISRNSQRKEEISISHSEHLDSFNSKLHSTANGLALADPVFSLNLPRLRFRRPPKWLVWSLLGALMASLVIYEIRSSALQSRLLSHSARQMTYKIEPGASPNIVFPNQGPFNLRYGYSQLPDFQQRLESQGFTVKQQARFSPQLERITRWGITPPYQEPVKAGLLIRSADGHQMFEFSDTAEIFKSYDQIPPLIVKALLSMENKELSKDPPDVSTNPVLEWDRIVKAGFSYAGNRLGLPLRVEGGSTLATQLEKYRHSADGRTESIGDKVRQMASASLNVYKSGTDTRNARREIILDYLNTVPLAAVPVYGEINGLGEGLQAWFGESLDKVCENLQSRGSRPEKVQSVKQVLSLLSAVPAPSYYLIQNRTALQTRVLYYVRAMERSGLIDTQLAHELEKTPCKFSNSAIMPEPDFTARRKTLNAIRTNLVGLLGLPSFYELDRLDLEAKGTVDSSLQDKVVNLFENLRDAEYLDAHGLRQEHLLSQGNPENIIYSLLLFEKTPLGNVLRVQTDNLEQPLDINEGMKMELGSTAKLRTLAHYLELVASLYADKKNREDSTFMIRDPITLWVAETLNEHPQISLEKLLQDSLDRTYSASPYEGFFTGGGLHTFNNFDSKDNDRRMTIREATRRSTNLVFIRLMRDLVRFHQSRLPYDSELVLSDLQNPLRHWLLNEAADEEAKQILLRAFKSYRELSPEGITTTLLGKRHKNNRRMAILFFAWHPGLGENEESSLSAWLQSQGMDVSSKEIQALVHAFGSPRLNLMDYGYLLGRHPLEVWCAAELLREPVISWDDLWDRSRQARQVASSWLYQPRHRKAQDIRLRIRIEQDAFARMTPYWRRLGFPFEKLVPSYATAIGNSSDRPAALAELMGIIVNDGLRRPTIRFNQLRFAENTPYHTVFEPSSGTSMQVMDAAVAGVLKNLLGDVVNNGTARRVAGAFVSPDGKPIQVGGKTGSGDNRFKCFGRGGGVISSRAVNRTATFVFYIGDRYYGALTASVLGKEAEHYKFTSALPVAILKLLAPALNSRI